MIAVEAITITQGGFALRDISFRIPTGEYAVLMGRTGSGKTTILEAIAGLRPIASGRVVLQGRDVTRRKPAERGLGYVPQDRALFPTLTVREHLEFSLHIRRWPSSARQQRVEQLAQLLQLEGLLHRKPAGLSGGESQRTALGRALAFQPDLLLLDEPLSALDETSRLEMQTLLRSVQQTMGVTTLHVTHNLSEARALADHVLLLQNGTIVQEKSL